MQLPYVPQPSDFGVRVRGTDFKRAYNKTLDRRAGLRRSYTPPLGMSDYVTARIAWLCSEIVSPLKRELLFEGVARRFVIVEEVQP